ncbi:MAG: sugar phosphate nucleotidyltransferase [candidate division KSB1 bacterium]|nr:sugar phosphate nucleotidyltransferase [candidate division KSB1 bacterium]
MNVRKRGLEMQAIIMAGGCGVRLAPYTTVIPKPLLPVDGMPIVEIIIRQLRNHGFDRVTLALGHLADLIRAYLGDGSKFGVRIEYFVETHPLGTIAPLALVENPEPHFLVVNADLLTNLNYADMIRYHLSNGALATVGTYELRVPIDLGVVETNGDSLITGFQEKPRVALKVSMGVYAFDARVCQYLEKGRPMDFPELLRILLERGEKVISYPFRGYWLDIGRHSDYAKAIEEFRSIRTELGIDVE